MERDRGQGLFSFRGDVGEPLSLARSKGFRCGVSSCSRRPGSRESCSRVHGVSDGPAFDAGGLERRRVLLGDQILAMFESVMEVANAPGDAAVGWFA